MSEVDTKPLPLYINGRFLTQDQTGVQRFAREVLKAIDALLAEPVCSGWRGRVALVTPPGTPIPSSLTNLNHVSAGMFRKGYSWEQLDLPRLTSQGVLLNLCNLAPAFRQRQVVIVHDAVVKARPDSYSLRLKAAHSILMPLILGNAARLITVSRFSQSEISHWYNVPRSRISVCYEGAEHILTQEPDIAILGKAALEPEKYFLGVGMGAAHKNTNVLLEGFSVAALESVKLVLTGNRPRRVHGGAEVVLPQGALHLGHVTDGELRALYENALALVYPSSYEGFGLPPVEAMICRCPVITSTQGAIAEVVDGAAYSLDTTTSATLAVALRRLVSDTEFRQTLVRKGLERGKQFTWRTTAQRILTECRLAARPGWQVPGARNIPARILYSAASEPDVGSVFVLRFDSLGEYNLTYDPR